MIAASSTVKAVPQSGQGIFNSSSKTPKRFRSSARSIPSCDVPMIGTLFSTSFLESFRGVCPPNVTTTPLGCSNSMTFITSSNVNGSKYSLEVVS